jgi:two-component system, LytTR family, sensor kinase
MVILEMIQGRVPTWQPGELRGGLTRLAIGVAVVVVVYGLVRRLPWPRPFRFRFVALHLLLAPLAALTWFAISAPLEALIARGGSDLSVENRMKEMLLIGSVFYFIVAGISYAGESSARAARAESAAANTQLAALRAQMHPHLLFNALHTVVQLIPVDPRRAAEAAELVGDLLRASLEEKREEVTLAEEWRFVSRYLELERIRFGDRLSVRSEIPDSMLSQRVPTFAIQTLVENAVQHGAAPRVEPTEIVVTASRNGSAVKLSVRNPAVAAAPTPVRVGTGLARLRERLAVLYGSGARLDSGPVGDAVYESALILPVSQAES